MKTRLLQRSVSSPANFAVRYQLPMFGMDEISIISGLQSLWGTDPALALLITFLAIFAPFLKTIGLALVQFGLLSRAAMPALHGLGKLAMAEVFLLALYIVIAKGAGWVTVETAWGLWLFTLCVLTSLVIAWASGRDSVKESTAND